MHLPETGEQLIQFIAKEPDFKGLASVKPGRYGNYSVSNFTPPCAPTHQSPESASRVFW